VVKSLNQAKEDFYRSLKEEIMRVLEKIDENKTFLYRLWIVIIVVSYLAGFIPPLVIQIQISLSSYYTYSLWYFVWMAFVAFFLVMFTGHLFYLDFVFRKTGVSRSKYFYTLEGQGTIILLSHPPLEIKPLGGILGFVFGFAFLAGWFTENLLPMLLFKSLAEVVDRLLLCIHIMILALSYIIIASELLLGNPTIFLEHFKQKLHEELTRIEKRVIAI